MKKQNLKSLKISKVLISNFTTNAVAIKGGRSGIRNSCPYCYPPKSVDPNVCSPI